MISSNTTSVQDDSALRSVLDGVYTALANNDADAFVRSAVLFPGETEAPADRWVWETWTLSSQNGKWLVQACHSRPVHTD